MSNPSKSLSFGDLLALKRWNTPTIYNGWEQITRRDPAREGFNLEETKDFMPHQGSMVGYAITVVIQPGHLPSDPKSIISSLTKAEALELIANGTISDGMIPKVETCIDAIQRGVEAVVIVNGKVPHAVLLELFTKHGAGTMFIP